MAKKLEEWEKTLQSDKLALIAYAVKNELDAEVNKKVDKQMHAINQGLTTSIAAAIFELHDFGIEQVEEIVIKSNQYMKDAEKFLERWGADWIMKINEIKPKIKEECIKLLEKDRSQADAIKILGEKFKDVPQKDRVNIFKETKEEWMKPKATENKPELEEKEVSKAITPDKENKSNTERMDNPTNVFEVIEKKVTLKGKYGVYEKSNSGIKAGELEFKNVQELKEYGKKDIMKAKKELEENIEQLKAEYEKAIGEFENKITEIEAVFSYEG